MGFSIYKTQIGQDWVSSKSNKNCIHYGLSTVKVLCWRKDVKKVTQDRKLVTCAACLKKIADI